MRRTRWLVVVVAVVVSSCIGGDRIEDATSGSQIDPNPTLLLCRNFLFGEPLDRPMANYVIYHWDSLHPWVRSAADDYTSGASDTADELERQCRSFLALLTG